MRLLLIATATLYAQTSIKPDQLRAAPPDAPKPVLLAYTSGKGFQAVTLGPGFTVTMTASGWVIDVAPTPAPALRIARVRAQVMAAADGSYPLSDIGVIFRNGLLMTAGIDYTLSAGRATPKTPWAADDIVVADEITVQ
jgi:hypothetical protein